MALVALTPPERSVGMRPAMSVSPFSSPFQACPSSKSPSLSAKMSSWLGKGW